MKNISNGFYIGIDSGGTKCELLITDAGDKIIYSKSFKGIHFSTAGSLLYTNAVSEYIIASLKSANLINCKAIGIGTAGAREEDDRSGLKKSFEKKLRFKNILVTTDAMAALSGAFEGSEGIILICGTGSVLYGYASGKLTRIGGWGRIIGDEGSGYWIGKRALNLVMKEYDSRKVKRSLLSEKLSEAFGINNKNVNEKIFQQNFEIQKIAPLVIESAEENCSLSKGIVNEAVFGLAEQIKTFLKVTGRKKQINISFIGSIIENRNVLSENLRREIKKLKIVKVTEKKHSSAFGAILLARGESKIKNRKIN
jgi:N-acetylglucosamine kinase-like BadF-type ATPase